MENKSLYIMYLMIAVGVAFFIGYKVRDAGVNQEIKEESIKRIAYALDTGMLTVNHDKIMELTQKRGEKTRIINSSELIGSQRDTNGMWVKSEDLSEDLDSQAICSTNNEKSIKIPEEG